LAPCPIAVPLPKLGPCSRCFFPNLLGSNEYTVVDSFRHDNFAPMSINSRLFRFAKRKIDDACFSIAAAPRMDSFVVA
jgi:hypothetical protein